MPGPIYHDLAAGQHGLVTRAQLTALAMPVHRIERLVHTRALHPVEAGVYRVAGAPMTWRVKVLASCLAVDGVASHRSAAVLHGIDGFRPGPPEISVTRRDHARRVEARVHWSTDLGRVEPVTIDGIPATPLARTVLDLGAVCRVDVVERAIDALLARRSLTWQELLAVYELHRRPGRRGCGPLRQILEERFGDGADAESVLEIELQRLLDQAGLRGYTPQLEIYDEDGFIMRLDVGWAGPKVGVEADSVQYHLNRTAFGEDRRKRARARAVGWFIYEATALDIRQSSHPMVQTLRSVLRDRGHPV